MEIKCGFPWIKKGRPDRILYCKRPVQEEGLKCWQHKDKIPMEVPEENTGIIIKNYEEVKIETSVWSKFKNALRRST